MNENWLITGASSGLGRLMTERLLSPRERASAPTSTARRPCPPTTPRLPDAGRNSNLRASLGIDRVTEPGICS
jgi:hypothetical protein